MKILPNIDYLNGLPVDREALDESEQAETTPATNHRQVNEIIPEEEAEATIDEQPAADNSERETVEQSINQSLLTDMPESQQLLIGQHLDTAELEAIAICYDQIRAIRKRLPGNNDFELGQRFDTTLREMMD